MGLLLTDGVGRKERVGILVVGLRVGKQVGDTVGATVGGINIEGRAEG